MVSIEELKKIFRGEIQISEPLARYTWMKVGGPADYYLKPADKEDVLSVVSFLSEYSSPYLIIGRGSNLIVHDEGYRGAAINLEKSISHLNVNGNDVVTVGAGVWLSTFVDFCIQHGFGGTEMLAGIPGTVGGAVRMNAGAYGGEISDYLIDVEVIRNKDMVRVKKEQADFRYRHSSFIHDVILEARFKFPKKDKEELIKLRRELLIKRNAAQPVNLPNSGSIFKNPEGNYAAKLIEECGLKGTVRGGAQISERHANFIVNLGNATANDIFELMVHARTEVYKKFGIVLENEVLLVGFGDEEKKRLTEVPA